MRKASSSGSVTEKRSTSSRPSLRNWSPKMLSKAAEVIEKQSQIIRIQADVINDLYSLLMQHITVEEAAKIRSTIEE
nr:MAG TPA: hypothetical protein [Caudoviricetes sp.]